MPSGPWWRAALLASAVTFACAALPAAAATGEAPELGEVVALVGAASVAPANQATRPLDLGARVPAGAWLRTGDGASLGVLIGEVLTQLDADTRARLTRTPQGAARVDVERGRVRVIDTRRAGAPLELAALDASASVQGGDTEVHVRREKVGPYAMFCEWDEPAVVQRGSERATAPPGRCVIANNREPLYETSGHEQRIPALAGAPPVDAGPPLDPTQVFSRGPAALPPVDAGGPAASVPGALAALAPAVAAGLAPGIGGLSLLSRGPCDDPGSGCRTGNRGPGRPRAVEQPPTHTDFPGGTGAFPRN